MNAVAGEVAEVPAAAGTVTGAQELRAWLVAFVAEVLGVAPEEVDPGAAWEALGVDSAMTLVLVADLSSVLGRDVRPVEVLANPTIDAVVAHVTGGRPGGEGR